MAVPNTQSKPRSEWADTLRFLAKLALIVWLFRSLVIAPFSIPSESMLPRLLIGDYLFVSKWNYGYSRWSFPWGLPPVPGKFLSRVPERGDVVVFRAPQVLDHDVIKRAIGLPGDTVQMRGGQLVLNGRPVPKDRVGDFTVPVSPNYSCDAQWQVTVVGERLCRYPRYRETVGDRSWLVLDQREIPAADDTEVYTVPAGHVFVMGDNRDNSGDSRFEPPAGMGMVPLENIEGRALVTFFSTDGSAEWVKPWTWFSAARPARVGEGF